MSKIGKQLLILVGGLIALVLIVYLLYLIGYQPTDFIYQEF